jgi:hypothetical protein
MYFSRFEYRIFYVLDPFVTYSLSPLENVLTRLYNILDVNINVFSLVMCMWWN